MKGEIKWYSITEYVDISTGEIISKSEYQRERYITIKISKTYKIDKEYGIIKYRRECEKSRQFEIW